MSEHILFQCILFPHSSVSLPAKILGIPMELSTETQALEALGAILVTRGKKWFHISSSPYHNEQVIITFRRKQPSSSLEGG